MLEKIALAEGKLNPLKKRNEASIIKCLSTN